MTPTRDLRNKRGILVVNINYYIAVADPGFQNWGWGRALKKIKTGQTGRGELPLNPLLNLMLRLN